MDGRAIAYMLSRAKNYSLTHLNLDCDMIRYALRRLQLLNTDDIIST